MGNAITGYIASNSSACVVTTTSAIKSVSLCLVHRSGDAREIVELSSTPNGHMTEYHVYYALDMICCLSFFICSFLGCLLLSCREPA